MTAMTLFVIAILVFGLMITGLYLSVREFLENSDAPSEVKESSKHGADTATALKV